MAVRPTFSVGGMRQVLAQRKELFIQQIKDFMVQAGELFVLYAITNGDYGNYTGNLRASIGYCVLYNGSLVAEGGFETGHDGTDKGTGAMKGQQVLDNLKLEWPSGFVLLGVAGMEYATLVETRGRDVITGAGITTIGFLRQAVQNLNAQGR